MKEKIENMFLGLAIGDALGVPVEFMSRSELQKNPVVEMREFGSHNQPAGTWSDDSSMTFCLAESLLNGYDLKDIAIKFIQWKGEQIWTPYGEVFDVGIQTSRSIDKLYKIINKKEYDSFEYLMYEDDEFTNGNGALMRILPLLFYIKNKNIREQFQIIREVSALTHGHIRSAISCLIYLQFAQNLWNGNSIREAYELMRISIKKFFMELKISERETINFERLIENDISSYEEEEIKSSGYVVHTLEASFWCLLRYPSYLKPVLKAVNLGEDTDTTAAVVGGIAGLYYGLEEVPKEWITQLARVNDIKSLAEKFAKKYGK